MAPRETDPRAVTAAFPSTAPSVAAARGFVRRTLTDWGVPELAGDAVLAVSELATNAVTYAGTAFDVICRREEGGVFIEVRDRHPSRVPAMPGLEETSGRGLPSIARLAVSWGVGFDRLHKGVWFRLAEHGTDPVPGSTTQAAGATASSASPSDGLTARPGALPDAGASPAETLPAVDRTLRSDRARESLEQAVDAAREIVAADAAVALLADPDGGLVVGASSGLAEGLPLSTLSVLSLGPDARSGGPWVSSGASDPLAAALRAQSLAAAPIESQGRLTGLIVAVSDEPGRFEMADGKRLARIAGDMALSLERARLSELERSWRGWLSFAAEASDLLAGTLDQERTMALVAQLAVPRLATWCAVYTIEENGDTSDAYVWHADETKIDPLRALLHRAGPAPLADTPIPWQGLGAAARPDGGTGPGGHLAYVFPMVARGRRIGMIVIGRPADDRFPRGTIELGEELGRRAAFAIDNARLYAAQTTMSTALQRSLLPPAIPEIPGLEVEVVYEPAGEGSEVGGDFYDVFACDAGDDSGGQCWRFAIGDVCGTGPQAAAVTGLARHALRILATERIPVPGVLARLNRLIIAEDARARLLTLLHGQITPRPDRDGVHIELASAGHPLPLLLDTDGRVTAAAEPQPLLGVFDDAEFRLDSIDLRPGQVLLCVTDGVTERRSGPRLLGDDNGLERVLAGCTGLSAGAVAARVQRAVRDFSGDPSNDDVALIVLRAS